MFSFFDLGLHDLPLSHKITLGIYILFYQRLRPLVKGV